MTPKLKPSQYLLQVVNYAVFIALVWFFSINPPYHPLQKDEAKVTLAFGHTTKHLQECRRKSQEELLKLPPNMRKPMDCVRGRSPLTIELSLDDKVYARDTVPAPGLFGDQGVDACGGALDPYRVRRTIGICGERRLLRHW